MFISLFAVLIYCLAFSYCLETGLVVDSNNYYLQICVDLPQKVVD